MRHVAGSWHRAGLLRRERQETKRWSRIILLTCTGDDRAAGYAAGRCRCCCSPWERLLDRTFSRSISSPCCCTASTRGDQRGSQEGPRAFSYTDRA